MANNESSPHVGPEISRVEQNNERIDVPKPGDDYCLVESGGIQEESLRTAKIAEAIKAIPEKDFDKTRSVELKRIDTYLRFFSDLYDIDMKALSISRTQVLSTIMKSYVLFVENMFPERNFESGTTHAEEDKTFFDSRLEAEGFQFSANGFAKLYGYDTGFSVLKRPQTDEMGEYEIDYPAISIDKEVVSALREWHQHQNFEGELQDNPIFQLGQEIVSYRIHDWLHASVLYDTQSLTKKFQKWSDDGFFVEHLFNDAGRINYEVLTNHIHFQVWKEIFKEDPGLKTEIIGKISSYLDYLQQFEDYEISKDRDSDGGKSKYMAFIGLRGVFDYIQYDDPELLEAIGDHPYYQSTMEFVDQAGEMRSYLDTFYDEKLKIPFGQKNTQKLGVKNIIVEYVEALKEELKEIKKRSLSEAFKNEKDAIVHLSNEVHHLPDQVKLRLDSFDKTDPRIFRVLNKAVQECRDQGIETEINKLLDRLEVDSKGHMYLQVEQVEIDVSQATEVTHQKPALFFTWPESLGTQKSRLNRVKTLITEQEGQVMTFNPGDLILVNIHDEKLGNDLLESSLADKGDISTEILIKEIAKKALSGKSQLLDMYTYDRDKAADIFGVPIDSDKPGVYTSKPNVRKAVAVGPVSLNVEGSVDRRRILGGAVAQNHVLKPGELDIFPVDEEAFDVFYNLPIEDISPLALNDNFYDKVFGNSSLEARQSQEKVLEIFTKAITTVNYIQIYGYRGKPTIKTYADLLV